MPGRCRNQCRVERHYGRHDIETAEQVFNILRTQVDVVLPSGAAVLNARGTMLIEMAALCDGEVIYFSLDPDLPVIRRASSEWYPGAGSIRGKRAVILRDGEILLVTGHHELRLVKLMRFHGPMAGVTPTGRKYTRGCGRRWALGMKPAFIRAGIENLRTPSGAD